MKRIPPDLHRGSSPDRRFSVGDFLLEIDEVLRPMTDLTDLMHEIIADKPDDPCIIPYRNLSDAIRAQTRLRLLLRDEHYPDRGQEIALGRTLNAANGEKLWALKVPHEFFVLPKGAPYANASNISDRVHWFNERREAIAQQVKGHKLNDALNARQILWDDLSQRGIIVTIPEEKLQRLMGLYEKLPNINLIGTPEEQLQHFVPIVQHVVDEAGKRAGKLTFKTLPEKEFIMTLQSISKDIFAQRHEIGRSSDPNDSHHYFPDDFATLLKAQIERALGQGSLNEPLHSALPRSPHLAGYLYTGQPTNQTSGGYIVSQLGKKIPGRTGGDS